MLKRCDLPTFAMQSAPKKKMYGIKNKHILNKLLPKIFPKTKAFLLINNVDDIDVNNSGRDVTAARRMPPSKAPERFVFLSNKST